MALPAPRPVRQEEDTDFDGRWETLTLFNEAGERIRSEHDTTADGRPSAQFEHTILMTEDGPEILTQTAEGPQKGFRF